jgi:hypothetical protein
MENIHQVLYAIINLYLKSETAGSLDPAMLDHIGKFMGQVVCIHKKSCDHNSSVGLFARYIHLLKHSKIGTRSNTCFVIMRCRTYSKIVMWGWTKLLKSLQYALFKFSCRRLIHCSQINTRPAIANDIGEMKKTAKTMHEELLELIQTLSDTSTSSDGSSVCA